MVVQSNPVGYRDTKEALKAIGLKEDEDFLMSFYGERVSNWISAGEAQLLVSGTFNGNWGQAAEMVSAAKKENPQLKAWYFSVIYFGDLPHEPYDRNIGGGVEDTKRYEKLALEVKKFLGK